MVVIRKNTEKSKRGSRKSSGTRSTTPKDIDADSVAVSDVSSLGNSVYSDTNGVTSRKLKQTKPPVTYMFPKIWKERTGSQCTSSSAEAEYDNVDAVSIARRRKIYEEDLNADLDWDTTMVVDEDRYRTERVDHDAYQQPSFMTCLSCL